MLNDSDAYAACLCALRDSRFVEAMVADRHKVAAFHHEDITVWVKRPEATGSNWLHRALYRLTGLRMLMPVQTKSPQATLAFEAARLTALRGAGIPAPRVLDTSASVLVLEDTGINLRQFLAENREDRVACENAVGEALTVLARIHRLGAYHAGAQIKNYTLGAAGVSAIDFEESFVDSVALADIQFRDALLFLFSVAASDMSLLRMDLLDLYGQVLGEDSLRRRLHLLGQRLAPLVRPLDHLPGRAALGHHLVSVLALLSFLNSI